MAKRKYDPARKWEIRVKSAEDAQVISIYQGPWTGAAEAQWHKAHFYYKRRIRLYVDDRDIMAAFYGHPDLVELEVFLDSWYPFEETA